MTLHLCRPLGLKEKIAFRQARERWGGSRVDAARVLHLAPRTVTRFEELSGETIALRRYLDAAELFEAAEMAQLVMPKFLILPSHDAMARELDQLRQFVARVKAAGAGLGF